MSKPLAEIIIEEGLATAEEVGRAADRADRERSPIIVALIRELELDEVAVVAALRRHLRVGLGDPATPPELDAVRELPREVARRLRVAPMALRVHGAARRLELAVADPTDSVALAEVEHITGCEVEPRLMPLGAVEALVEASYRQLVTEVMKRETRPRAGRGVAGRVRARRRGLVRPAGPEVLDAPGTIAAAEVTLATLDRRQRALIAVLARKGILDLAELEAELDRPADETTG